MLRLTVAAAGLLAIAPGSARAAGEAPQFLEPVLYGTGAAPASAAIGDVTGDGRSDVLVTTGPGGDADFADWGGKLFVYPGSADGGLGVPTMLPTHDPLENPQPPSARTIALADFDRDGKTDAATVTPAGVDVYLQRAGALLDPTLLPGTAGAYTLAAADMNGDGMTDLVVERWQPDGAWVGLLINTGATFTAPTTIWTGNPRVGALDVGDLDSDGRMDVVISGERDGVWFWTLLQKGDGTFAPHAYDAPSRSCCAPVAVGDFTGDGVADIAAADGSAERIYPGTRTGPGAPIVYPNYDAPIGLVGADLDGDERTDLLVAETGQYPPGIDPSVQVFMQRPDGTLAGPTSLYLPDWGATFGGLRPLAAGDLNGDGRSDIAVVEPNAYELVVFRQAGADTTAPQTTITSGPPSAAPSTVTFSFASTEASSFICSIGNFWWPCTSPVTYEGLAATGQFFQVAAIDRAGNIDPTPAAQSFRVTTPVFAPNAPANDRFANALLLSGYSGQISGDSTNAIFEAGEPSASQRAGGPPGRSVWFTWTAPSSGPVTFTTAGSSFNNVVGVFTGSAVSSLTPVASEVWGPARVTSVTFDAAGGTTYRIKVDGWVHSRTGVTEAGPYTLAWSLPDGAPQPQITAPLSTTQWSVGQTISFSGSASDREDGTVPASRLRWALILHECLDGACGEQWIRVWDGTASGSFAAPDTQAESVYLELRLIATDSAGLSSVASTRLDPRMVVISFGSYPISGLTVDVDSARQPTPYHRNAVAGSSHWVNVPAPQRDSYDFVSWADGGARGHTIRVGSSNKSWFVTFDTPPQPIITAPTASMTWSVGQTIAFSGSASDYEDGNLPASRLTWELVLYSQLAGCDGGIVESRPGVAFGSFVAPDTRCPGYLELRLTARDSHGSSTTTSVRLDAVMVVISFGSQPESGLDVIVDGIAAKTPYHRWAVVGSTHTINAPGRSGAYDFGSWDDGGSQTHTIVTPSFNKSWFAHWLPHNEPPRPEIAAPTATTRWAVADTISFSGSATDPEDGALSATSLRWQLDRVDCSRPGPCTVEPLATWTGVSSGSFVAPDYPRPVQLIVRLTATDSRGAVATASVTLNPATVVISFGSYPDPGIEVVVDDVSGPTPQHREVIVGSTHAISAPSTSGYVFVGWDDGGAQTHTITAPASNKSWFASYTKVG